MPDLSSAGEVKANYSLYVYMDRNSFSNDEPVKLHICVKNTSGQAELLKIYDELFTTFQPVVYDAAAREAENIVPYRMMNKKMGDLVGKIKPRIVELSRGEIFEQVINLRDVYRLDAGREYRVEARFSPDASSMNYIRSENIFTFTTFRSSAGPVKSGVSRISEEIRPSEIVHLFLNAEKNRRWDDFLKYLKLEDYIQAYPDFVSPFRNADEVDRAIIIDEFIKYLKKERTDYLVDFDIMDELFGDDNMAYVDAEVKRYGPRSPYTYKYRYTLERFRSFWRITDVEATVIKGHRL